MRCTNCTPRLGAFAFLSTLLLIGVLHAQRPDATGNANTEDSTGPKPEESLIAPNLHLTALSKTRTALADHGITLAAIYTGEEFGNPIGGVKQGQVYDGLVELDLDVDFAKLAHWDGLKLHVSGYDIHGPSGTNKYVGDFNVFSSIDFYDSARLNEYWLEQQISVPHLGKLSLRLGQQASDKEFYNSELSAVFVNSSFGALPTVSVDVPANVYGVAALGARLRWDPVDQFYAIVAVYDGNPDPDYLGDPSPGFHRGTAYNHNGLKINLNSKEGAFAVGEADWLLNQTPDAKGLPGTYKFGGWYHTDTFSDERFDNRGHELADPDSTHIAEAHSGNYGGYFMFDQALWVAPTAPASPAPKDGKQTAAAPPSPAGPSGVGAAPGLGAFIHGSLAPQDRNLLSLGVEGGLTWRGLLPGRPKDVTAAGVNYTKFSDSISEFDRDKNVFAGVARPPLKRGVPRDDETDIELTYLATITTWWAVQPDAQFIIHPGGTDAVEDALVLGVRTVFTF